MPCPWIWKIAIRCFDEMNDPLMRNKQNLSQVASVFQINSLFNALKCAVLLFCVCTVPISEQRVEMNLCHSSSPECELTVGTESYPCIQIAIKSHWTEKLKIFRWRDRGYLLILQEPSDSPPNCDLQEMFRPLLVLKGCDMTTKAWNILFSSQKLN